MYFVSPCNHFYGVHPLLSALPLPEENPRSNHVWYKSLIAFSHVFFSMSLKICLGYKERKNKLKQELSMFIKSHFMNTIYRIL